MTLKRKSAGSFVDIATTLSRRASGAWVGIDLIRRRASGAWTVAWRRITITDQSLLSTRPVGIATCGYRLNTSGIAEFRDDASYSTIETWIALGSTSGYEARATVTLGALTSGTTGSWLALSSSREWTVEQSVMGTNTCEMTVEIRNATTLETVASANIILTAERT